MNLCLLSKIRAQKAHTEHKSALKLHDGLKWTLRGFREERKSIMGNSYKVYLGKMFRHNYPFVIWERRKEIP